MIRRRPARGEHLSRVAFSGQPGEQAPLTRRHCASAFREGACVGKYPCFAFSPECHCRPDLRSVRCRRRWSRRPAWGRALGPRELKFMTRGSPASTAGFRVGAVMPSLERAVISSGGGRTLHRGLRPPCRPSPADPHALHQFGVSRRQRRSRRSAGYGALVSGATGIASLPPRPFAPVGSLFRHVAGGDWACSMVNFVDAGDVSGSPRRHTATVPRAADRSIISPPARWSGRSFIWSGVQRRPPTHHVDTGAVAAARVRRAQRLPGSPRAPAAALKSRWPPGGVG